MSEGECIVLCKDTSDRSVASSEGISKIVAMDDTFLWVASGNSSVKRWRIPPRRGMRVSSFAPLKSADKPGLSERSLARRRSYELSLNPSRAHTPISAGRTPAFRDSLAPSITTSLASDNWFTQRDREDETTRNGIPFQSLVRLTSANDHFAPYISEVATLYSAASVMSIPQMPAARNPLQSMMQRQSHADSPKRGDALLLGRLGEDAALPLSSARAEYEERELAAEAEPLYDVPDDVIVGDHGLVRSIVLNDRIHSLSIDTSGEVAVWDIVRCICLGRYFPEDVAAASHGGSVNETSSMGERERSPREALEAVRDRIEGETIVLPWCSVDTKTGVLTVHIAEKCFEAEIYADEAGFIPDKHFSDETRSAFTPVNFHGSLIC